jgi:diguanylate cyclase (GGDEF)-like protein
LASKEEKAKLESRIKESSIYNADSSISRVFAFWLSAVNDEYQNLFGSLIDSSPDSFATIDDWNEVKHIDIVFYARIRSYLIALKFTQNSSASSLSPKEIFSELEDLRREVLKEGNPFAVAQVSSEIGFHNIDSSKLRAITEFNYAIPYLEAFDSTRKFETHYNLAYVYYYLALVHCEMKHHSLAQKYARNAIEELPDALTTPYFKFILIRSLSSLQRYEEAEVLLQEIRGEMEYEDYGENMLHLIMAEVSIRLSRGSLEDIQQITQLSKHVENMAIQAELHKLQRMQIMLASAAYVDNDEQFSEKVSSYEQAVQKYVNIRNSEANLFAQSKYLLGKLFGIREDYERAFANLNEFTIKNANTMLSGGEDDFMAENRDLELDIEFVNSQKALLLAEQEKLELRSTRLTLVFSSVTAFIILCFCLFLWKQKRAAEKMANSDSLTGALTRRAMFHTLRSTIGSSKDTSCLALVDLDLFKQINDTYGHSTGDEVLKAFTDDCKNRLRKMDRVARFGGEEFLIFLSDIELEEAVSVLEDIRTAFTQRDSWESTTTPFTANFSCGVVEIKSKAHIDSAIKQCDELLYDAKKQGRAKTNSAKYQTIAVAL